MELHISLDGPGDLSTKMYDQIRAAIVAGRVQPGQRLPSTRELAGRLAVSRTTVGVAFDRLLAEGFVHGRVGAGTFVSATPHPYTDERPATSPLRPRPVWDRLYEPLVMSDLHADFDFRSGVPDASRFPYSTWRALMTEQLRPGAVGSAAHIDPAGVDALRTAIARHVGVSRAVRAVADDVFVTSGSQQAVDLIARVLLEPGERVAVEDPGYPPVRGAFTAHGAQVVGVPVDAEGLVTDALPDDARLVYVTPSHQFPLGVAMSLRRRLALLAWAERTDAAIVEDDYDSEYRYGGRPLEPLHSLDHTGSRAVRRLVLQGAAAHAAARLPRRTTSAARRAAQGQAPHRLAHPGAAAGGRGPVRRGRAPRPAHPAHASDLRPATPDDPGRAHRPARAAPAGDPVGGRAAPRRAPAGRR